MTCAFVGIYEQLFRGENIYIYKMYNNDLCKSRSMEEDLGPNAAGLPLLDSVVIIISIIIIRPH